jgi:hypothetical protein
MLLAHSGRILVVQKFSLVIKVVNVNILDAEVSDVRN